MVVASKGGYANVVKHDLPTGPHVSVETVTPSGSSLHAEQLRLGGGGPRGGPTTVGVVDDVSSVSGSVRVDLPDAAAAQAFQRGQVGSSTGTYNVSTTSCLTHACDVLRAGGANVPTGARDQMKWLRSQGGN